MRLLWMNLATDATDPLLGFATGWIRAVSERVDELHVLTMRAGKLDLPPNVRVYSVGKERGYSEPRRAVEYYRHLSQILNHQRIDGCFSHMAPLFSVLAAPMLRARGIPLMTWYAHPGVTMTLRLAHICSTGMVTSLPTAYPYRRSRLTVLGQGIDTDQFAPDAASRRDAPPAILCVGRLSPIKDHPTLLQAAALLRRQWTEPFRLVIIGGPATPRDREYARVLQAQATELGIAGIVRFEPPINRDGLPQRYREAELLVNLTPTGSGDKVVLEAMSSGIPCLAANQGFAETFGAHADRLLFRFGDPADLAKRLREMLERPEAERERLGACLRERVVKMHSLERLADRIVALFTAPRAAGRKPSPPLQHKRSSIV